LRRVGPAFKAAGWGVAGGSRVRREFPITPGRIEGPGRRGEPLTARYILEFAIISSLSAQTGFLLPLATGNRKTSIAFQIAWKERMRELLMII